MLAKFYIKRQEFQAAPILRIIHAKQKKGLPKNRQTL